MISTFLLILFSFFHVICSLYIAIFFSIFFFFFSSRRRHTRFSRDWSSDVCSSDLRELQDGQAVHVGVLYEVGDVPVHEYVAGTRSEERRVGKECRSRWSPDQ